MGEDGSGSCALMIFVTGGIVLSYSAAVDLV